jgi:hypothetical protein
MRISSADIKTKTADLAKAIGIKAAQVEARTGEERGGTEILLPLAAANEKELWAAFLAVFPFAGMVDLRKEDDRHMIRIYDLQIE